MTKKRKKKIYLSMDEWNVWYHSNEQDRKIEKWSKAPHQLEDVYNLEDALLIGSMMITMLKHCDRVKMACLAQLINVIAPIMTSDTGAWRQTIFYPYMHGSVYGRGTVLQTMLEVPTYDSKSFRDVPYVDLVVIDNAKEEELVLFAVNKNLEEEITVSCELRQFADYHILEHQMMTHADLKAVNTEADPDNVKPVPVETDSFTGGMLEVKLPAKSWNMIRLKK